RQHRQRLRLLPPRPGDDLHAAPGDVARIGQREPREATTEKLVEAAIERRFERPECRRELVGDHRVELLDELPRADDRRAQVALLRLERLQAGPNLGVLLDGERIRSAEVVEAAAKQAEALRAGHLVTGLAGSPRRG